MRIIQATSANDAWKKTLTEIYEQGAATGNDKYFRDEVTLIEVSQPEVAPAHPAFSMAQADLDIINRYIYTGEQEDKVVHDWTKLYYHRAFDEPNSQIEFLVANLNAERPVGEAQISMWDKNIDQGQKVSPCTQIIWARIKHGRLELHVHANSSDVYKKLLMNMLEFISLQHYIAERIGLPVGAYYHFLDSGHIHHKDLEAVKGVMRQFEHEDDKRPRSAVLVIRGGKALLIERRQTDKPLWYVLPGGGLETDEIPEQAAVREMREELGVEVEVTSKELDPMQTDRETWIVRAEIKDGAEPTWQEYHKQSSDNHYAVCWLPLDELERLKVYPRAVRKITK